MLDQTLFSGFTIMNRCLHLRSNNRHPGYDTLNRNILVYEVSFQSTRSHVVLAKVTFKVYIVLFSFSRKSFVVLKGSLLIITLLVASVILNDAI